MPKYLSRPFYAGKDLKGPFEIRVSRKLPFSLLTLAVVAFALLMLTGLISIAAADGVYHSQHIDLIPVGDAPLRSGFVENIHVNGPKIYARELYVLNGASPSTSYQVSLAVYVFDPDCSVDPVPIPSTTVQTNVSGNGTAQMVFTPDLVPSVWRDETRPHGVRWEFSTAGTVAYETACSIVTLD